MSKVEILNIESHAEFRVSSDFSVQFSDVNPVIIVTADELPQVMLDFPVFIAKSPSTGEFELKAVMGFAADENLFVHEGRWRAAYMPLDLQRGPFQACLVGAESVSGIKGADDVKVGIDVESTCVGTDKGQRLFNDDGSHTDYLTGMTRVLGGMIDGLRATNSFLKKVSDAGLIEPVELKVDLPDDKSMSFDGLYTIHHERLSELSAEDVLEFHRKGYLQACYAIMHSTGHIEKLVKWKSQKES